MNKKPALGDRGFAHVILLIIIALVITAAGYGAYLNYSKHKVAVTPTATPTAKTADVARVWPLEPMVAWEATGQGGWISTPYDLKPPACPSPLGIDLPTPDADKITSILYPGQTRLGKFEGKGGNYKPHGGFRFDKAADNNITVEMPYDGYAFRGSRYLTDGEIQYGFDFINPCGIMVRLGHLRDLTPSLQAIADKFPPAVEGDSRTTKILPVVKFKSGDKLATAVGFRTTKNVGFDYGVYDLRTVNQASQNPTYKTAHADTAELSAHALCWLNLLDAPVQATVKALPAADAAAGKTSDYCI